MEKDLLILKEKFSVSQLEFSGVKNIPLLFSNVRRSDLTLSWFGKLHAFFAVFFSKMFKKKSVLIAGGDDVAKQTALNKPYGLFSHPIKKWFGYFIFKYADLVIAISNYNYNEIIENTPVLPQKVALIPHGFDTNAFHRIDVREKKRFITTVGYISHENYWRKGFALIKRTARLMPDLTFYIVGSSEDGSMEQLRYKKPDNLCLPGALYGEDLIRLLSASSVYLQLSEWESFGCALAEAMLCECVPVVFNGTALPEVVGDCGFYVDRLEPKAVTEKIREALREPPTMGERARQRILKEYPLEKRQMDLISNLRALAKK